MTKTLSSTYPSLVTLSGTADNPTTITSTGRLNAGLYADSLGTAWMITNAGSVLGAGMTLESAGTVVNAGSIGGNATSLTGSGVDLLAGASVTNQSSASISGYRGLLGYGSPVTVVNGGTIAGSTTFSSLFAGVGVDLFAGGSVANQSGASISGFLGIYDNGNIVASAAPMTVLNAGNIQGDNSNFVGAGVRFGDGGSVTNQNSASISGYTGIYGHVAAVTVVNYGSIAGNTASGTGIALRGGGSVTNQASASISGFDGIYSNSAVTVVNAGSIVGLGTANAFGIELRFGGLVTNAAGATITSGDRPVGIYGSVGTVVNAGLIFSGTTHTAVELAAGGSVTNQAGGAISSADEDGVYIVGGVGTVVNDGSIAGLGTSAGLAHIGVDLQSGGSVTNAASASITGSSYGVVIHGGAGTVVNDGSIAGTINITGTSGRGIQLEAGGSITNGVSASITGVYRGAEIAGGAGVVVNDGSIWATGTKGFGVEIGLDGGAGTVDNFGTIWSAGSSGIGILLESGGSVANYGGIAGTGVNGDGVDLSSGGSVTNAASASITGSSYGVLIHGGVGTLVNDGSIAGPVNGTGTFGRGVQLDSGGLITNGVSASITGVYRGAEIAGGAGTVVNDGNIVGTGTSAISVEIGLSGGAGTVVNDGKIAGMGTGAWGVLLEAGGSVANAASASITGYYRAVVIKGGAGTVVNDGSIVGTGTASPGIKLESGGSVTNAASGSITGALRGARIYGGTGNVVNFGSIVGTIADTGTVGVGVELDSGGSVTNAASASIIGATLGVYLSAGGTLTNAGTIVGNTGTAVVFAGTYTNLVVIDPGAVFVGTVNGGATVGATAVSTLDLASGASAGTLIGLGSSYVGFGQITVGAFASWLLDGTNTISSGQTLTELSGASLIDTGTLVNDGAIVLDPSTMTAAGLTGIGSVTIDGGSTLDAQGTIAGGETLAFGGSGAYLHLDSPGSVAGTVTNFGFGETIDLKGIDPTSVSYSDGILSFGGGSFALSLANTGPVIASTSGDGAAVTAPCFRAGTRILTPSGERLVQELAVDDLVRTMRGEAAASIVWIGRREVDCARHPNPGRVWPVRVAAEAFGPGRPHADLFLSPDHAIYVGDVLIPVKFLINGSTIAQVPVDRVTYYHLELPEHDVLLAEGLPAESFLDTGDRCNFENCGGPTALYPDFSARRWDTAHIWEALGCARLIVTGPELQAARMLVNSRAAATTQTDAATKHAA